MFGGFWRLQERDERIYLDFASATPVLEETARVMEAAGRTFGNPGSLHREGVEAKALLEKARADIAIELGSKARQLIFTSGLTESNNLAILGVARKLELEQTSLRGTHWITSTIEHSSILEAFADIERRGGEVTFVDPDERGLIEPEGFARLLRPATALVSIGWGNNEIGVVQKMSELALAIKNKSERTLFHSDAGQAPLYISPQVHTLGVDLMSLGSGKLYGPRGVGALYVRDPSRLSPIILGGGQEKGLRSGTEEVSLPVGFASAMRAIGKERAAESRRLRALRADLANGIGEKFPHVIINTDLKQSLPHMLNISVPGEKTGEYLALQLDVAGVAVSTKSACDEGNASSHVVAALHGPKWRSINTLRFSLGRSTTKREVDFLLAALVRVLR
ncbi:MAG: hypothetical protein RLZZ416_572 [Candidatus Parcubacteria bacterium]|jgi:cysteine desulfurase